jgi:ParB family chromosome partitioning protein
MGRLGAGIIGATQRSIAEIREERDRLLALVAKGGSQQLEPDLIDPSPFPDRLPDDNDSDFEAFKKLLLEEGQKVPIQVRPHPAAPGRYQIVYGRRRLRAARELGQPVNAIIAELTDTELVIAQGIENSARQDLSWIERALFAWRMHQQGIAPRDIKAALSVDDAELHRFRHVASALPFDVIEAIGRAPKVGRPRWIALVTAIAGADDAIGRVRQILAADKVSTSDERFLRVLSAAAGTLSDFGKPTTIELKGVDGAVLGKAVFGPGDVRIKTSTDNGAAFLGFLRAELPTLMEKFLQNSLN